MSEALVPWCSPDPRALFPLDAPPHWSRSLKRSLRTKPFRVTVDTAFSEVIDACADREGGTWITGPLGRGYRELHALGWAHSVEVWNVDSGALVGGIYGVAVGALFAGESMFHRETDASKVAFVSLARLLRKARFQIFDVQVMSPHLESLGCINVSRVEFLRRLGLAVDAPRELPDQVPTDDE
jgi:leucyl/phenylalanyl-tRNA--protein transferase